MKTICNQPTFGRNGAECIHLNCQSACLSFQPLGMELAISGICRHALMVGSVCSHGQLDRQCEVCERDARIAELEAEVTDLEASAAIASSAFERGRTLWQTAHPEAYYWPDGAKNVEWLVERIAELEAEVARCRAVGIDPDEWHRRLASAREAGARGFAEVLLHDTEDDCVDEWFRTYVNKRLARFLASGTGNAEKKDGGK